MSIGQSNKMCVLTGKGLIEAFLRGAGVGVTTVEEDSSAAREDGVSWEAA